MTDIKRWVVAIIKVAVAVVLLGILVNIFFDNFGQIKGHLVRLDWRFVVVAALIQCVVNWALYEYWILIVRKLGGRIGRRAAWKAFFLPYVARYIPGKVALVAGKVHYCAEEGIPARVAVISIMVENGLIIIAGLSLAALSSFYLFYGEIPSALVGLLFFAALALLVCLHPAVFRLMLNVPMRLFRRNPIRRAELLGWRTILVFFAGYAVVWLLAGLFYALAAAALDTGLLSHAFTIGAALITAGAVGQASMLAPAGLGVREGVLYLLLESDTGPALAVAAVALARLITVLVDLGFALATPFVTGVRVVRDRTDDADLTQ